MNKTKKTSVTKAKNSERAVVVCTDSTKRGVFFGYTATKIDDEKKLTLSRARMAVYWSQETKGILGLAATGPLKGSRITPSVPSIDLEGCTCLIECDPAAVEAWESGPWQS